MATETLTVLDLKDIADRARAMGVRETEARYAELVKAAKNEQQATHGNVSGPCDCPLCRALANLETTP